MVLSGDTDLSLSPGCVPVLLSHVGAMLEARLSSSVWLHKKVCKEQHVRFPVIMRT